VTISNNDFHYIQNILHKQVGIVLGMDKLYLVENRLTALAQQRGLASLQELLLQLRTRPSPDILQDVVDAMAINETLFFRDEPFFETLKTTILPDILVQRAKQRTLSIWSAACSSGQEPYSIAILLREYFPQLRDWNVRLIASDISSTMLARSRKGCYTQFEVKRGLPEFLRHKYFQRCGKEWQIKAEIGKMVEFNEINLTETWPSLPALDLLLLRNVLIYFDDTHKKIILNKVQRLLKPNGYLFAGTSETALNRLNKQLKIVQSGTIVGYQVQ